MDTGSGKIVLLQPLSHSALKGGVRVRRVAE
jgi:hypothetical protein